MAARAPQTAVAPLAAVRRHRAELLEAMQAFERALAVPAGDPAWLAGVARQLARLRQAFADHVGLTEGAGGLYGALLIDSPRLANEVTVLAREHVAIQQSLDVLVGALDAPPEQIRVEASDALRSLFRHRQRGADLIYEAYTTDIGGEN
jgi:hypothetical protein